MRAVNLLPEEYRPRRASGGRSGSAYVIVGVLGLLLALVTVYVLTANQVSSRQADTAEAKRETQRAQDEISKLGPFGSFADIKQTRVASVRDLAQARFDWERFVREVALVLPRGSWLTEVDASASGESGEAGAAPAAAAGPTGPNAKLMGCAPRQPDVAKLMVRLRKLHRVKDVELKQSAKEDSGESGAAAAPTTSGPASGGDCTGRYQFDLVVQFDEASTSAPSGAAARVPASLGGGG